MRSSVLIAFPIFLVCLLHAVPAAAEEEFADGQTWGFEIAFGGGGTAETAYTRRLEAFGYTRDRHVHYRMSMAVEKILVEYFSLLLQFNLLDGQRWSRPSGIGPDDEFDWNSWTLDVHARAFLPFYDGKGRAYIQVGLGPTFTGSRLKVRTSESDIQTTHGDYEVRYNVAALAGLEGMIGAHVGFFFNGGYFFSPAPKNRLDDVHQGGGLVLFGLSGRWRGRQP